MRVCAISIGAFLTFASPALAEPVKQDAPKPTAEQPRPAAVVLASADTVRAPAPTPAPVAPAQVKRVAPRVTTCRCGDPQPDPESQEQ